MVQTLIGARTVFAALRMEASGLDGFGPVNPRAVTGVTAVRPLPDDIVQMLEHMGIAGGRQRQISPLADAMTRLGHSYAPPGSILA